MINDVFASVLNFFLFSARNHSILFNRLTLLPFHFLRASFTFHSEGRNMSHQLLSFLHISKVVVDSTHSHFLHDLQHLQARKRTCWIKIVTTITIDTSDQLSHVRGKVIF